MADLAPESQAANRPEAPVFAAIGVELVDHMGSDLAVVNAARVSFDKASEWASDGRTLRERDRKLIAYLARHNHWTPFAHTAVSLRVKAPIFVARQAFKHKVGLVENEVSRRYVDSAPEIYEPGLWRERAPDKKQGSRPTSINSAKWVEAEYRRAMGEALMTYRGMISQGLAPELARIVLPQSTMTEWIWTGSVAAFARVCRQRFGADAQAESRELAHRISAVIEPLFPVSWSALMGREAGDG